MKKDTSLGIYVHIPFCIQKCRYCDFCSRPGTHLSEMDAYVDAVCREIKSFSASVTDKTVDTVFFGGGTPTLLPKADILRIITCLRENYPIASDAEWTVEANPATLDADKCAALVSGGVNRLSIGMQSAVDEELSLLGRVHKASDLPQLVALARAEGFANISLDLMMGIPAQTPESFAYSLDTALSLSPTHLSVYALQIEEGTPFWRERNWLPLPSEEEEDTMQTILLDKMKAEGFIQYEISNFARAGFASRHNLRYWQRKDYLGFGPAAHACFENCRSFNPPSIDAYIRDPLGVRQIEQILGPTEQEYEAIILGLRTAEGIDEAKFAAEFGEGFWMRYARPLLPYEEQGLVCHTDERTYLTPRGMRLSNSVLTAILSSEAGAHLFPSKDY